MKPAPTDLRRRIVDVAKQLAAERLVVGTSGNVSGCEPGADECLITPSGVDYDRLEPDDLVRLDFGGRCREGQLKPSSDTAVHLAIYRARPEIRGVVHTHSPYATAFSVARREIPPVVIEASGFLGGSVPPSGDLTQSGRAVLLPNHGVLAVGETVEKALMAAQLVEHMARVAYLAERLGDATPVAEAEIRRVQAFLHGEYGQAKPSR